MEWLLGKLTKLILATGFSLKLSPVVIVSKDSAYEKQEFQGDELIISATFSELKLTASQVLRVNS